MGRTPWSGVPSGPDAPVPLLEPRCQPPRRHGQADEGVGRGPGGPPHKRLQNLSSYFLDTTRLWKKMKKELSILGGNPQGRKEVSHAGPDTFIMLIHGCGMVRFDLWLGALAGGK